MRKKWRGVTLWLGGFLIGLSTFMQAMTVEATGIENVQTLPQTGEEIAKTAIIGGLILVVIVVVIVYLRRKKEQ